MCGYLATLQFCYLVDSYEILRLYQIRTLDTNIKYLEASLKLAFDTNLRIEVQNSLALTYDMYDFCKQSQPCPCYMIPLTFAGFLQTQRRREVFKYSLLYFVDTWADTPCSNAGFSRVYMLIAGLTCAANSSMCNRLLKPATHFKFKIASMT